MSCRPTARKKKAMPKPTHSQTKVGCSASATARIALDRIDSTNGTKRSSNIRNNVDIGSPLFCRLLRSRIFQPRLRLREVTLPQQLDRLHQGPCRVARLLLKGAVGVERRMALRIGLIVADVAVDGGFVTGAQQAHIAEPVGQRTTQGLGAGGIAMDHDGKSAAGEMTRVVPTLYLEILRLLGILARGRGRIGIAAVGADEAV